MGGASIFRLLNRMFGQEVTDGVLTLRPGSLGQGSLYYTRKVRNVKGERPLVIPGIGATCTGVKSLEHQCHISLLVSLRLGLEKWLAQFIMCNHLLKESFLEALLSQLQGG